MTIIQGAAAWRGRSDRGSAMRRVWRRVSAVLAGALLVGALSGCACRPGYVGPYGGFHPGRCFVG